MNEIFSNKLILDNRHSLVLLILLFLFTICNSSALCQETKYHYEPNEYTISGTLKSMVFYGPPNYGETPDIDRKETAYILFLDESITLQGDENSFENSESEFNVLTIQLVYSEYEKLKTLLEQRVIIKGSFFHSITGHHHTKVLMSVKLLEKQ